MEKFSIVFIHGTTKWIREELTTTEDHYAIVKGGEWFGEGNFCGWYSYEYLKDVEVYGILDEKYKVIEIYKQPRHIDKLVIYSCMWGGNKTADTIDEIINNKWC